MTGILKQAKTMKFRGLALLLAGATLGAGITVGVAYWQTPAYEKLPTCAEEDGNPDGSPCWWTDPGTKTRYYVTSENYR